MSDKEYNDIKAGAIFDAINRCQTLSELHNLCDVIRPITVSMEPKLREWLNDAFTSKKGALSQVGGPEDIIKDKYKEEVKDVPEK